MKKRIDSNRGLLLPELSFQVVGACMRVHNELGSVMLEKYYQRAVEKELEKCDLKFTREKEVKIQYDGESIGKYFIDFIVEDQLVLELKVCKQNISKFHKQVLAYLRQLDLALGIVVNFRRDRLTPYRVINSRCSTLDSN